MSSNRRLAGASGNMVQSKADRERQRLVTDKCQSLIEVLLKDEDNKYCVDCDAKGPRWASWNLGIFLCIRCAGIHRNLGVHISKVKSVNLDAWTPEHVAYVQRMGNSRARAIYEANLPDDFRRPQTDTALESFIRAKYEHKRYIAKDYVDPGPPAPAFNIDDELKKMKEQKRNKANASATRIISVPELPANPVPRPTDPLGLNNKIKSSIPDLVDLDMVAATEAASGPSTNSAILGGNDKPSNTMDLLGSNNRTANTMDLLVGDLDVEPAAEAAGGPSTNSSILSSNDRALNNLDLLSSNDKALNTLDLLVGDLNISSAADQTADSKKVVSKEYILSLYSKATPADFARMK